MALITEQLKVRKVRMPEVALSLCLVLGTNRDDVIYLQ